MKETILTAAIVAFISAAQAQGYIVQSQDTGPLTQSHVAMAPMSFRDKGPLT